MANDEGKSIVNDERFRFYKAVRDRFSGEKSICNTQNWNVCKKIFINHGIHTPKVTHGGRHSGSAEAHTIGVSMGDLKHGCGWKEGLSRLETNYIGKLPLPFARGMAGFKSKPFHLERNIISPSIELQRKVFPWIESVYGVNKEWYEVCTREMNEYDDNYDDGEEPEDSQMNVVEEDGQGGSKARVEQTHESAQVTAAEINKRGFLKLLVRLRRVILQDAAAMLFLNRPSKLLEDAIFSTPEFLAFKEDVFSVLRNSDAPSRLQEFEGLVPEIINAQRELSGSTQQINNQILRTNQHFDNQFAFMMHTINSNHKQEVEATSHHNSLLNAMSFQLQQQDQQIKQQQAMIQTMLTSQYFPIARSSIVFQASWFKFYN
ncbi:hypothetical protein BD408DRAFT_486420 [Parasitella parasitica]|nr:hypothetical protein BD408DRAFT_486420 [Parasitella parasitica]